MLQILMLNIMYRETYGHIDIFHVVRYVSNIPSLSHLLNLSKGTRGRLRFIGSVPPSVPLAFLHAQGLQFKTSAVNYFPLHTGRWGYAPLQWRSRRQLLAGNRKSNAKRVDIDNGPGIDVLLLPMQSLERLLYINLWEM